jgi:hypothetical protein
VLLIKKNAIELIQPGNQNAWSIGICSTKGSGLAFTCSKGHKQSIKMYPIAQTIEITKHLASAFVTKFDDDSFGNTNISS